MAVMFQLLWLLPTATTILLIGPRSSPTVDETVAVLNDATSSFVVVGNSRSVVH